MARSRRTRPRIEVPAPETYPDFPVPLITPARLAPRGPSLSTWLRDALAIREVLNEYGACICALYEGGERPRELFFEDIPAARQFAKAKKLLFEFPERPRGFRAVDYTERGDYLELLHSVTL